MSQVLKVSKSALAIAALAAVASFVPAVAKADALAQAILRVQNFSIIPSGLTTINVNPVTTSSYGATLFGAGSCGSANNINPTGTNFTLSCAVGPNQALYSPGVANATPNAPTGTFAGSTVDIQGSALVGGATALVDTTVSLAPNGSGQSTGTTNLTDTFTITLSTSGTLSFSFDAYMFLRAYLSSGGAPFISGSSVATANWSLNLVDNTGNDVFRWVPNGSVGTVFGGSETRDAFALDGTNDRSVNDNNLDFQRLFDKTPGSTLPMFAASTNTLSAGTYTLTVNHQTTANSRLEIPEPTPLALIGIAMVAAAAATRRRRV
jgi:hypothetical protein